MQIKTWNRACNAKYDNIEHYNIFNSVPEIFLLALLVMYFMNSELPMKEASPVISEYKDNIHFIIKQLNIYIIVKLLFVKAGSIRRYSN